MGEAGEWLAGLVKPATERLRLRKGTRPETRAEAPTLSHCRHDDSIGQATCASFSSRRRAPLALIALSVNTILHCCLHLLDVMAKGKSANPADAFRQFISTSMSSF